MQRKIVIALILEAIFIAVMVFVTLFFFQTTKDRSMIVGLVCVVFNIIMYAAPLTVMVSYLHICRHQLID